MIRNLRPLASRLGSTSFRPISSTPIRSLATPQSNQIPLQEGSAADLAFQQPRTLPDDAFQGT